MFFDLDAALITLQSKLFSFDRFVNAVCLPNKFDQIDESWDGEIFTIAGFGRITNKDFPTKLQIGQKSMFNCQLVFKRKFKSYKDRSAFSEQFSVEKISSDSCFENMIDPWFPEDWEIMKTWGFCVVRKNEKVCCRYWLLK